MVTAILLAVKVVYNLIQFDNKRQIEYRWFEFFLYLICISGILLLASLHVFVVLASVIALHYSRHDLHDGATLAL